MTEKCKDRIGAHLLSRLEDMDNKECAACQDWGAGSEQYCEDHLTSEGVLSVDRILFYKIHLSTGGPGDWFMVELDEDGIRNIEYHFHDWWDHAQVNVVGQDFDIVSAWIYSQLYIEEIM